MTAPAVSRTRIDGSRPRLTKPPSASAQASTRNRGRMAAGGALLATSAVLAVLGYGNLGQRSPVLAAARAVSPGQVINDADLKVVNAATDPGAAVVSASHRSAV